MGATRPKLRVNPEHVCQHFSQLLRVLPVNGWVLALEHALVESVHVVGAEGRLERAHFVQDAAQRPDIRLRPVRLILPHFWACVVRSACLRVQEALLGDFADIQITQLRIAILLQENIGALQISVQDVLAVECSQGFAHFDENFPDCRLADHPIGLLILDDFLVQIAVVEIVHHDAQARARILEKGLFVTDNARMAKGQKKSINFEASDTYWKEARIRTSFKAFSFSLTLSLPIFTCTRRV